MKSEQKMDAHIRSRLSNELKARFLEVCNKAEHDQSDVVRELIKAAIRYYDTAGDLYPPFDLIPGKRGGALTGYGSTVVSPVINGHGNHVQTDIRKRKK